MNRHGAPPHKDKGGDWLVVLNGPENILRMGPWRSEEEARKLAEVLAPMLDVGVSIQVEEDPEQAAAIRSQL